MFNKLLQTYLSEPERLKRYYHQTPSLQGIVDACGTKEKVDRAGLVQELKRQYINLDVNNLVGTNIDSLLSEHTFCITTAHQLNLFLGPLYYVHKILSVIKTAEVLNQQPSPYLFVPVFVMGSEDHDKEEVDHTLVHDRVFKWDTDQSGAVGRFVIDDAFIALRDSLLDTLQDHKLKDAIKACYKPGILYGYAHRCFLHYLFSDYGLVIIDFDSDFAKEICYSIFKDEIENHRAEKVLSDTLIEMEKDFDVQAKPRSINIFKLEQGKRVYIEEGEDGSDIKVSDLSPNVIYRPLMQQKVLPSVCYVGGAGELGYWLELKSLFEFNQVQFPVLMLRNHALYVEKKVKHKMVQWGIEWKDLWKERELLANEVIKRTHEFESFFMESKTDLANIFDRYRQQALQIDATLLGAVESEHKRVLDLIAHLEQKLVKGAKRKNETLLHAVDKAQNAIFREGALMERKEGFLAYYDLYGKMYFDHLLNQMAPFSKEILILQY